MEIDFGAFGAADPVALHRQHTLGPALFEFVGIVQQLVGVGGDAEEPLFDFTLLDRRRFVAPAAPFDHLLVGEHRRAFRAPVHARVLAIGEAALQHLQEQPLVPAVILGLAGGDLAVPVVAEGEAPVRLLHLGDIGARPVARVQAALDGGVFGRKTEGIPAHRVQHVVAAHPLVAGERIADGVVAHVSHVQRAARVRQHLQHVILGLRRVLLGLVQARRVLPALEPLQFDALVIVGLLRHSLLSASRLCSAPPSGSAVEVWMPIRRALSYQNQRVWPVLGHAAVQRTPALRLAGP